MKRLAASKAHPSVPRKPDISNGEGLHINGMGAYPGLTHGGHTTTFRISSVDVIVSVDID
jgi:hypothetical protein